MKIKTIVRIGVAALAMGAFFGVSFPVRAGELVWVRAQPLNYFQVRGLVPPGSYSHMETKKPATIAVNKGGQGVGEKKQTTSKFGQQNRSSQPTYNNAEASAAARALHRETARRKPVDCSTL
jgi:hypothetical protein